MSTETNSAKSESRSRKIARRGSDSAPVYGLGLIGALVYYIGSAATFGAGLLGVLKAIVWPAMLVFELLKYLNM